MCEKETDLRMTPSASHPRTVLVVRILARSVQGAVRLGLAIAVLAVLFVAIRARIELSPGRAIEAKDLPARIGNVDTAGGFSFAVLGDREDERDVFRACLERAKKEGCLFVVLPGNLVFYGTEMAYALLMTDLRDFGYAERVATVRGSHDPPWLHRAFFGSSDWSFEFGGARFVGLDDAREVLRPPELDRIEKDLAAPRSGPLFVVAHKPVFAIGSGSIGSGHSEPKELATKNGIDTDDDGEDRLRALCIEHHVDLVLAAHLDVYDRREVSGVTQIVSGTAGGRSERGFDSYGFVVVEVANGKATARRVEIESPGASAARLLELLGLFLLEQLRLRPLLLTLAVVAAMIVSALAGWAARSARRTAI